MRTKILLADDHAIVRDGLKMILTAHEDMTVVGEAGDGREALLKAETLQPDIVIMDIAMPVMNGIEATRSLCRLFPSMRVVMLSMHHTSEHVFRSMQAGARAYLLKESAGTSVVQAVRAVMKGQYFYSDGIDIPRLSRSHPDSHAPSPIERLSSRELEVLQMVVEGRTSAEIADVLSLSPKTVETYRSRLMLKLDVANLAALVKFAILHGITPTEKL